MTHFDVVPSVLDLIEIPSGTYFGLGVSLFSDVNVDEYNTLFNNVTSRDIMKKSIKYKRLE